MLKENIVFLASNSFFTYLAKKDGKKVLGKDIKFDSGSDFNSLTNFISNLLS